LFLNCLPDARKTAKRKQGPGDKIS